MKHDLRYMHFADGYSLSELLVSLLIVSILMITLTQSYVSQKKQYHLIQKAIDKQLEITWINALLTDDIRKAGFTPCFGITQLQTADRRNADHVLSPFLITEHPEQALSINRMSDFFEVLTAPPPTTELKLPPNQRIKKNKPLMIADCHHAEVHNILSLNQLQHSMLIHLVKPLRFRYIPPIYVGEWLEERWSIHKNRRGIQALFYDSGHREELTDQIHGLYVRTQNIAGKTRLDVTLALDEKNQHVSAVIRE